MAKEKLNDKTEIEPKPIVNKLGEVVLMDELTSDFWMVKTDLGRFARFGEEVLGAEF